MIYVLIVASIGVALLILFMLRRKRSAKEAYSYELVKEKKEALEIDKQTKEELLKKAIALYKQKKDSFDA